MQDYTDIEICSIFRRQEDRSRGVEVLMQLTCWPQERIEDILIKGGYCIEHKQKPKAKINHDEALALYLRGWTNKEIANYFGVNTYSVSQWKKRNGLSIQKDLKPIKESIRLTIELYEAGYSKAEIARQLNVSKNCIAKRIGKYEKGTW